MTTATVKADGPDWPLFRSRNQPCCGTLRDHCRVERTRLRYMSVVEYSEYHLIRRSNCVIIFSNFPHSPQGSQLLHNYFIMQQLCLLCDIQHDLDRLTCLINWKHFWIDVSTVSSGNTQRWLQKKRKKLKDHKRRWTMIEYGVSEFKIKRICGWPLKSNWTQKTPSRKRFIWELICAVLKSVGWCKLLLGVSVWVNWCV